MSNVSCFIKALPDALYRACTDLGSIAQWRVPDGMTGKVDSVDGATYRMSLTYPDGRADKFEATFVDAHVSEAEVAAKIRPGRS